VAQPEKFTAEQIANALIEAKGFVSVAAKNLGCAPNTIRNYIKRYATCSQAVTDTREEMKDFAESKLFIEIKNGNITAIIFYLKTQAKDRGYVERQEHSGPDGGPIPIQRIEVVLPPEDGDGNT
jgi:predicted transcriptional regulator